MRRRALAGLAVMAAVLGSAERAPAIGWGGVEPGVSTLPQVRERWGAPSTETRGKEDGHDTLQWVYEGASAPPGMMRMVVDFGLLRPEGYKPELVRAMRLDPRRGVFGRQTVVDGWGAPNRSGIQDSHPVLVYNAGLLVYFDPQGEFAIALLFSPPLPPIGDQGSGAPGAAPPASGAPPRSTPSIR